MTGSAFIVHNNTWSCSNDCVYSTTRTPNFVEGNPLPVSFTPGYQLVVHHPYHPEEIYQRGDKCELIFKNEDTGDKFGFQGEVEKIGKENTIIKIFTKTDRISEILSNITFKN